MKIIKHQGLGAQNFSTLEPSAQIDLWDDSVPAMALYNIHLHSTEDKHVLPKQTLRDIESMSSLSQLQVSDVKV